jgi:hypothetical protein
LHYDDGERVSYYTGDALQGCVNQQLVGNDDFGQPINAYWQSKTFDVGFPEHLKKFKEVILIDSPSNLDLELQASLDYGRYNYLLRAAEDDLVRRYRFPAGSYGRYLSLKLVHNTTDSADVRGITALYRPRRRMR